MRKTALMRLLVCAVMFNVQCSMFNVFAQVGDHRSELAIGVSGGYALSKVGYLPKIPQTMHGGATGGVVLRYTSEKYFKSICAIVAEVNYTRMGWKESILTPDDDPVINTETGLAEEYQRDIDYIQVPVFARLGWGRERSGVQVFFQAGPQVGCYLNEKTKANFDLEHPNTRDRTSLVSSSVPNASNIYFMPVENKLDYGIAAGLGLEFSHPAIGHIMLEGRYYYGLGNIYGNTKRDYFAISNYSTIYIKMSYLFDIARTKNPKIK
jgi:hypothetical protein